MIFDQKSGKLVKTFFYLLNIKKVSLRSFSEFYEWNTEGDRPYQTGKSSSGHVLLYIKRWFGIMSLVFRKKNATNRQNQGFFLIAVR